MIESFWAIIHNELQRYHLGIAPSCENELRRMLEHAVEQVRENYPQYAQGLQQLPHDVSENAEDKLRIFIRNMAQDALRKGYTDLHEDTFLGARGKFCPGLWPFC